MKKHLGITAIALIFIMLAASIFSTGCGCLSQACQPYGPRVTGDGTGGAIAVYEDIKGGNQHDFYVQKISPEGKALWGEKGVLVGSSYKQCDSFPELHIVGDGHGGALVSWSGYPSEPDWKLAPGKRQIEYLTHITKVDAEGSVLWEKQVRGVDHMISDGAGGAIIATDYSDDEETLFTIKIDSEGNFPWGEDGVYMQRQGYRNDSLDLVDDGNQGAIIVWRELKGEPSNRVTQIFTQKIDVEGNLSWSQDGEIIYTSPEEVKVYELRVTNDSSGGAIIVWHQEPVGTIEEDSPKALFNDIYAQHVDTHGAILWTTNGMPLETHKGGVRFPNNPIVVSDDAGGAIILWGGPQGMYGQKIDAEGNINWQPGGVEVTSSSPYKAISDDSGGAIVTFGTRAQKIDAAGRTMWSDDGIMFADGDTHDLAYDGLGGAVVAWGSGKSTFKSEESFVQRIDSDGNLLWGEDGVRLNP